MADETTLEKAQEQAPALPDILQSQGDAVAVKEKTKPRRSIPGDFSYTPTYGKLKIALDNITRAERPEVFNKDYVASYLGVTGGSATPIPPILRRLGFLSTDGRPTDLYAKFQNPSQRPSAALEGLKKAFPELFKRHTFAHTLSEDELKDVLVEITGLKKSDAIIGQIYGTFDAVRQFVPSNFTGAPERTLDTSSATQDPGEDRDDRQLRLNETPLGLAYHINIVLPETKDIAVFNAIFQSLRQNLLS